MKIGLPAGIQGVVFSASNVCIQSSLNSLGSDVVAGSAAALNFEFFAYYLLNSFSQACVTFTSQNFSAGNYKRCHRVTYLCLLMGILSTSAMCGLFIMFDKTFIRFYVTDPAVVEIGLKRMKYILSFQFINAVMDVFSGSLRGMRYSLVPALMAVIGVCGVRLLWVWTVFKKYPTFKTLMRVYPVSWAVTALSVAIAYFVVRRFAEKPRKMPEFME